MKSTLQNLFVKQVSVSLLDRFGNNIGILYQYINQKHYTITLYVFNDEYTQYYWKCDLVLLSTIKEEEFHRRANVNRIFVYSTSKLTSYGHRSCYGIVDFLESGYYV